MTPEHRALCREDLALLREKFPAVFGSAPKPLRIGVHDELRARVPELSNRRLKRALALWTADAAYLSALLAEGAMRHTLDGSPVEPVKESAQAYAKRRLAARIEHIKEQANRRTAKKSAAPKPPAEASHPAPAPPKNADHPAPESARPPRTGRPILRLKKKRGGA